MKNQTAIEWLSEQLRFTDKEAYAELYEAIEQAKVMEKDQIEDAFYASGKSGVKFASTYYNETYNN